MALSLLSPYSNASCILYCAYSNQSVSYIHCQLAELVYRCIKLRLYNGVFILFTAHTDQAGYTLMQQCKRNGFDIFAEILHEKVPLTETSYKE